MKVQYDGYYGIQSVSKKLSMMNAYQFAEFAKDGHDNAYLDANPGGHRMTRTECARTHGNVFLPNSFPI